jgi:uncharacterized protein (DUF427 family)
LVAALGRPAPDVIDGPALVVNGQGQESGGAAAGYQGQIDLPPTKEAGVAKRVKLPAPDHPIAIAPHPAPVVVIAGGRVVAETRDALALHEATYPPVLYIPREDVDLTQLERTDHVTYCPYKGKAAYYSIPSAGKRGRNAVWTYEAPYEAVSPIKYRLAFYPNRVDAIDELPQ